MVSARWVAGRAAMDEGVKLLDADEAVGAERKFEAAIRLNPQLQLAKDALKALKALKALQ